MKLKDGTYNFYTDEKVNLNSGFMVSYYTKKTKQRNFIYEHILLSLSADGVVYKGVYMGKSEISFCINDLFLAKTLGKLFKQISIWDNKNKKEIKL